MTSRWLGTLLACGCGAASAPVPLQAPPPWTLDTNTPTFGVEHAFTPQAPLILRFTLPPGRTILPGASPAWADPTSNVAGATLVDDAIFHLQLPFTANAVDESTPSTALLFGDAKMCRVDRPCPWPSGTQGLWEVRVRRTDGTLTRLPGGSVPLSPTRSQVGVIGVWLPAGEAPIVGGEQLVFSFTGTGPQRATDWMRDPAGPFRPKARWREHPTAAWEPVPPETIAPMEIVAGAPALVEVRAPLDVEAGVPFEIEVVVRDRFHNPTRVDGTVRLVSGRGEVGPLLTLQDAWRASTVAVMRRTGLVSIGARQQLATDVRAQYVGVWPAGQLPYRRLVGDLHVHTGIDGIDRVISHVRHGDHRGSFTSSEQNLRYLDEVGGLDFGALAEHASGASEFTLPPGAAFDPFRPGGPCSIEGDGFDDAWWLSSQSSSHVYQLDHPGFVTFPAWEWHGTWRDPGVDARLHKVVIFREHDDLTPYALPMLPGVAEDRAPACLFAFLERHGLTPDEAVVIPHLMHPDEGNLDWALTTTPPPGYAGLVSADASDRWQPVGEIFSSRNNDAVELRRGARRLAAFEGLSDPAAEAWSFRHAWRDLEVVIGVVGGSDSHMGMPGADDPPLTDDPGPHVAHEPGGLAFVLAEPARPTRDGVFEALQQRRTYATSGPRVWLDLRARTRDGTIWRMGSELGPVDGCDLQVATTLAAGQVVREVTLWGVPVGRRVAYAAVDRVRPRTKDLVQRVVVVPNPLAGRSGSARWMYHLRAFLGAEVPPGTSAAARALGHDDAVWSSPIWVDWQAPPGPCP